MSKMIGEGKYRWQVVSYQEGPPKDVPHSWIVLKQAVALDDPRKMVVWAGMLCACVGTVAFDERQVEDEYHAEIGCSQCGARVQARSLTRALAREVCLAHGKAVGRLPPDATWEEQP